MLFLGLDDTDSLKGGCTTHLAIRILEELVVKGPWDLIGFPRLVRLNPNVPWKTRGNGAVALGLGKGLGEPLAIGEIDDRPLQAYANATPDTTPEAPEKVLDHCVSMVERWSHAGQENTNPGLVLCRRPLAARHYWQRVRSVVAIDENRELVKQEDMVYRGWGNGRGLIGAVGALAWPAGWVSYELLANRQEERWGSVRQLRRTTMERLEFEPGTFDSFNQYTGQVVVAPRGPDPVLFGLRGLYPPLLKQAAEGLADESVESWCIWATNQGSDDHLRQARTTQVGPYASYRVRGRVMEAPQKQRGGHLFFTLEDDEGTLQCAAFEPGKPLPAQLELLKAGDEVEVYGGTHATHRETRWEGESKADGVPERPTTSVIVGTPHAKGGSAPKEGLTLAVEKLRFIYSASKETKVANPRCKECGRAMKSLGKDAGYRCKPCGRWAPEEAARFVPSKDRLSPGWYEPPAGQKRHLARPRALLEGHEWQWERFVWRM